MSKTATRSLGALSYSAGEAHSIQDRDPATGRRRPTLQARGYDKQAAFLNWASTHGYRTVTLDNGRDSMGDPFNKGTAADYGLLDFNRDGMEWDPAVNSPANPEFYLVNEALYYDLDNNGVLSDDERDEDADGLTNFDEAHGRMTPEYWTACYTGELAYPIPYLATNIVNPDTDGDGVLDGADDQDHDDIPNVMELSRVAASGLHDYAGLLCIPEKDLPKRPDTWHLDKFGYLNPFNPCLPYTWSRTCQRHPQFGDSFAPFSGPWWYSLQ